MRDDAEPADTLEDKREPNGSAALLAALEDAERKFAPYLTFCKTVDKAYALACDNYTDEAYALFWASVEILKPAIYAKPPKAIASPRFKDGGPVEKTAAELIERCLESEFDRGGLDDEMLNVRDDLALTNRGVTWVTYESDKEGGGQRACVEHLDRSDFRHEPARKWSEVGWVARRAWMTFQQMKDRFTDRDDAELRKAAFEERRDKDEYGSTDSSAKAGVWEVWSRTDNRVYWVTEGVSVVLDEDEPHLDLRNFFPCPKPAYGTLQRRTLIPVPDYKRYETHLEEVNKLTARIYTLLDHMRLKVLIPAGGDVSDAVQKALASADDSIVISVPAAAFQGQTGSSLMLTVPLTDVATAIQSLIAARAQLFQDFDQLSGISDIMRGETEAQETLGAQRLKSQYGSVRVRDKIDELQRLARDTAQIVAEIMAANFSSDTLLDMARMEIPTKAELEKKLAETEKSAKEEMQAASKQVVEAASQQQGQVDPQQVQQQFMQKQQEIQAKYQPLIKRLGQTVVIEDVMKMLRDKKSRNLVIDIETDSTIMTDEVQEKASRAEFLQAFQHAAAGTQMLMAAGEPGAKLAGGILKFALQPYRANRELDTLIDEFVESAGSMPQQDNSAEQAMAAANMKIAEAEYQKAQAAIAKVQADTAKSQQEIQLRGAEAAKKAEADEKRIMLELEGTRGNIAETGARIKKIDADIELAFAKLGIERHREQREDVKAAADIAGQQQDRAAMAQDRQRSAFESDRDAAFGEKQAASADRRADRAEDRADRQQDFAESQPA